MNEQTQSKGDDRPLKIIFFPLSWVLAHVGRTVEIAKVLREAGHEVIFAGEDETHPRSKLPHAQAAGFRVVHVREPRQYWAFDRFRKYGNLISIWDSLNLHHWAPIDLIVEDIVRVCEEEKPDLIVGDASIGVSTAAHILGIRAAGIMNAYNGYFVRPWSIYSGLIKVWDGLILSRVRGRVYKKRGVHQINAVELLRRTPLISPDLPVFHKPQGHFPNWHAVGPIITEPPAELPPWFDELEDGTTNIYISMGSTGLLEQFLDRCITDLGKLPYRFVVTTGGQISREKESAAPANFRFCHYAPGSEIMKRCKALIFHGGNGTMYQALAWGVPMVALPSHLEQEICVDILEAEGMGLRFSPRKIRGPQLVQALENLLNDASYVDNIRRYQKAVQDARGAETAAEILVEHGRNGQPAGHGM
jgi:UDP:flavonoid glycosyltransferase YjiC (YdhE family)